MRRAVLVVLAIVMLVGFVEFSAAASLPQAGVWTPAASMSQIRSGAAAAALPSGAVLITGGSDENGAVLSSAEVFSADGTFKPVAPMNVARTGHTATWVPDSVDGSSGVVLVVGGTSANGVIVSSAELYDPVANSWTLLPALTLEARTGHTATLLPNSSVLLAGGQSPSGTLASMEVFSLANQQFTFAGTMTVARKDHAAAALKDGRVLVVGGTDSEGNTLASTTIFDPTTNTATSGPSLATPRANATATTLLDGTVLIAAGSYPEGAVANANIAELNSAEIFDPLTGSIATAPASLSQPRARHLAFLLPHNNNVLIVGGVFSRSALASAELFAPWTGQFAQTGSLAAPRSHAIGAPLFPLADGQLLIAGGNQQSAELYGFATIKTDADDYAPGTAVMMSGAGWVPGETVTLYLHEVQTNENLTPIVTIADEFGNIVDGAWAPDSGDDGIRFYLTAVGSVSQAQTTFTDASRLTAVIVGTQNPNPVLQGNSASYTVSFTHGGNGALPVTLSVTNGMPANANASFSPNPVDVTASSTLTITTAGSTPPGSFTITVQGVADATRTTTAPLVVAAAATPTTTVVTSGLNPSIYGGAVTFTATVSPSGATGTVTFKDGATTLGTGTLTGGAAIYTTGTSLSVSSHSITAVYGGDASYTTSTSSALSQVVNKKPLTINGITVSNKTYDGTTSATLNGTPGTLIGKVGTDVVSLTGTAVGTFADKNVGASKTVTVSGQSLTGTNAGNYILTEPTLTANITSRAITVTAATDSKPYDGTTTSSATPTITTGGLASGDTATWTQTFNNKHVGTNKTLTPAGSVSDGNSGNNYVVTSVNATGTINARAITVTAATDSKPYDGTTASSITPTVSNGSLASGDTAAWTQTFSNKNVGSNKTLTPAGSVTDGNGGNNYSVAFANNTTGTITARAITVTAATDSKAYDGTTSSSAVPTVTGSLASGDTATWTQSFNTKNVGANKTLTPAGTVSDGNGGNNYSVTFADNTTGAITGRTLTLTATGANKIYDGTVNATVTLSDDRLSGETLTASYTGAAFADKNVGNAKSITVIGASLSGADSANYTVAGTLNATANITPATLTVTAVGGNKIYDGTTAATVVLSDDRLPGDALTASYSNAAFADKNVGSAKAISVTELSISGADAVNYQLTSTTATAAGNITPATLTFTADNKSKVYGSTLPTLSATPSGFVGGDTAAVLTGAPSINTTALQSSVVGSYPITVTSGDLVAANYTFAFVNGTLTVTHAPLTLTADDKTMAYGGVAPVLTFTADGFVNGDTAADLTTQPQLSTTTSAAGVFPITISGAASPNYTIIYGPGTMTVSRATLTITAANKTMVYGDPLPAFTYIVSGYVNGDTIEVLGTQPVVATAATSASPVGAYAITLSGAAASDYDINYIAGTLTITKAPLTVTPNNQSRLFRRANPTLTGAIAGLCNGDAITATFATTATTSSPGGTYPITVASVTDGGTGALGNYTVTNGTGTLTVTNSPVDLIDSAVSISGTPAAGKTMQVTETVVNQGGADAATSSAFLYLSNDGVNKGTYLTTWPSGSLLAGASSTGTATVTLPTNLLGTYYIIACADGPNWVTEGNEANNCSASASFTVAGADLIVNTVSVLTASPVSGGSFQVSDTTSNTGAGNAGTSSTYFYLSLDGSVKGTTLGSRSAGAVIAADYSTGTATFTLPTNLLGTYYIIACADTASQVSESNETNNCKTSASFTVAGADVSVSAASVLTSSPVAGGNLQISDTTSNLGAGSAATSMTYFYLSMDGGYKGTMLGSRATGAIAAGASSTATTTITLPTNLLGTYYVIACADAASYISETNETNNCKASATFTVAGADLTESALSVLTANPVAGGNIQISDTVANSGSGNAGTSTTYLYFSFDGVVKGSNLGSRSVATVLGGASSTATTTVKLPNQKGTYYIIACADAVSSVTETSETNNCKASASFTVQ